MLVWSERNGTDRRIRRARFFPPNASSAAGSQFCFGTPNSTGDRGFMRALGTRDVTTPKILRVSGLPLGAAGLFTCAPVTALVPNAGGSQGFLCLGAGTARFGVFNSGTLGEGQYTLNPLAIPRPTGTVSAMSGQSWYFQAWHRDANPTVTSNFTNAVRIPFL